MTGVCASSSLCLGATGRWWCEGACLGGWHVGCFDWKGVCVAVPLCIAALFYAKRCPFALIVKVSMVLVQTCLSVSRTKLRFDHSWHCCWECAEVLAPADAGTTHGACRRCRSLSGRKAITSKCFLSLKPQLRIGKWQNEISNCTLLTSVKAKVLKKVMFLTSQKGENAYLWRHGSSVA